MKDKKKFSFLDSPKLIIQDSDIDSESKKTKFHQRNMDMVSNFEKQTTLPKKNEQVHLITQRQLNSTSLILSILKLEGIIEELYLSTFRIGKKASQLISDLVEEGNVKKLILVVSDSMERQGKDRMTVLTDLFSEKQNCEIKLREIHAKLFAIKTKNNNYTITGSGNLTSNSRIEYYTIQNDKSFFDFISEFIKKI